MVLSLLVGLIFPAYAPAATSPYPAKTWDKVESPEALGWSSTQLKTARAYSEEIGSAAVMIVVNGEILDEWGDTTRKLDIRSLMKPLMNALYVIAVEEGQINIQSTLDELGVDDTPRRSSQPRSRRALSIYCKPAPASTTARMLTH